MPVDITRKIAHAFTSASIVLFGDFNPDKSDADNIQTFTLGKFKYALGLQIPQKFIVPEADADKALTPGLRESFKAFYLPAEFNKGTSIELNNKADVFITDALTGCSVVITKTKDGRFKAYHFNALDQDRYIDQEKINQMIKETIPLEEQENIVFKLTKDDYGKHDLPAPITVVGLRDGDHWHFHYQYTKDTAMVYQNTMTADEKVAMFGADL